MPMPAGTGLSRRSFLARSPGSRSPSSAGPRSPRARTSTGIADAMAAARQNTVLVSVFLDGGLDTLSLLAPAADPTYQALRPTLKLAPDAALAFRDDDRLQWHSAAAPLKSLHEQDRVTVIPAIGYSSPNQSHFTSRHYYEVGELNESGQRRLDGPLARSQRRAPTTRCRGCRSTRRSRRRSPRRRCRSPPSPRRRTTRSPSTAWGRRSRRR